MLSEETKLENMADSEIPVNNVNGPLASHSTTSPDEEVQMVEENRGGWITFPFITVGVLGMTVGFGWTSNLIVYLIQIYNIKRIDATQINNVISGCIRLFPVVAAILADSFFGNFSVVTTSILCSLLGLIMLTLTVTMPSLRPPYCNGSVTCESPSKFQFSILFTAISLASIGAGCSGFATATMGANQFNKAKDQAIYFNWYFIVLYVASVINVTAIIYIQDNIGWGLGFGLCLAATAIGLAAIVLGNRYYRHVRPQGSPFTSLARVVVAAIRKRKVLISSQSKDYHYEHNEEANSNPSTSLRFLNCAALKTEGDTSSIGSTSKSWKLCTVEEVEDLKQVIRLFPLLSTGILLSTTIGIQGGLVVLQALSMNRHIGSHFRISAGSFPIFLILSTVITLFLTDRLLYPVLKKWRGRPLTSLQLIGIGHVLNAVAMAGSAIVETKRLHVAQTHHLTDQPNSVVPMSAMWLVVPLALIGVGEALHFPGQVALFYQEFPTSIRTTAIAMVTLLQGIAYYLSTALVDLVRRVTPWLPDNINEGRLDNVFWLLLVIGVVNFGYFLACAIMYKYKNAEKSEEASTSFSYSQ